MAGSNAWSWVEDNNLEKASSSFSSTSRGQSSRKHGIERSSSFHALPHSRSAANLTGSGSSHSHRPSASPTPGPRRQHTERARHPSDERRVRRTSSLTLKHQKQHKNSVAGSQPSPSVVAPPPIGAERKKSRVDSLRLAGRSLLKKATDILAISGQQDSEESSIATAPAISISESVTANADEYFDAVSHITQRSLASDSQAAAGNGYATPPENLSGIGITPSSTNPTDLNNGSQPTDSNVQNRQMLFGQQRSNSSVDETRGSPIEADDIKELDQDEQIQKIYVYDPFCPMHGSRRRLNRRHRLKSNRSYALTSMDTVDFSVSDVDAPMYSGQRFAAKLMRKRRRAILTGHEKVRVEKQKFKIKWNVFVMSVAFLLLFTAFHGLQNLQTTVNSEEYLGAVSLSVVYLSLAVSSLFLPSYLINRLGCKQAMIVSMAMYTLYMLANFIPRWYALVPASVLVGMAGSCLWAANCIYITETGVRYSHLNIESPNGVIVRFFGYFFMIVHMGQVFGNLISSLMLEKTMHYNQPVDRVEKTCGHFFTGQWNELSETGRENLTRPPQRVYLAVCAIYVCCTIIATLILTLFLNTLHKDEVAKKDAPRFNLDVFRRTLENLRKPKPVLLIPLTIFNGMEQAFIVGEFTKAYVACGLGLSQIGFVMTAFGIADAVCSLVFGPLIKLFGRMPLFIFGAVVDMLMIFTLLVWPFNPGDTAMFYVIACAWGMADGVWNTQLNGFWVALVGQHLEVAFANYRFWESFGLAVAFLLMRFTTTEIFLYILLGSLFLGMIGYFAIEIYDHIIEACAKGRMICIDLYNFYRDSSKQNVPTSMEASLISTQPIQGGRSNPLVLPDFDVSLHI